MSKNNKATSKKYDDLQLNNKVMYSDNYIENGAVCGGYIDGKCSVSGKNCDCCASTYQNNDY